jgi:hypothetical protein
MKKILLMFLIGTMTMFSQTIKVRGVVLTYDKVKKVMRLTTTPKIMYTNDTDMDVKIEINKEFALKMNLNGVNYSMVQAFFELKGHTRDMGSAFIVYRPGYCREIKSDYIYEFSNLEPGEYLLTVSNVCDEKYVSNEQTMSIQIN